MLAGGERVLVAVSGGADSVALLHVLMRLAPSLRLTLHVAHVDHGLRPESADEASFVARLAHHFGLRVEILPVTVPPEASLEAAARRARYAALEKCADRVGADRIAVAHTANDQAETVVMRLLEGAGPRGLAGIPPVRGRIIRPLIDARREEIVTELERADLPWVEDPSNRDPRFLRNRIRHDVLPVLRRGTSVTVEVSVGRVRLAVEAGRSIVARPVALPGTTAMPEIGAALTTAVVDADGYVVPRGRERVAFDADLLPAPVRMRPRRRGDRFLA